MIDIGQLLGYEGVANDLIYLVNPDRIVMGFELHASHVSGVDQVQYVHTMLSNTLSAYMPDDSWVSIYHCVTNENPDIKSEARSGATDLSLYIEEEYHRKLNMNPINIHRVYMTICIPILYESDSRGVFDLFKKVKSDKNKKHEIYADTVERAEIVSDALLKNFRNKMILLKSAQLIQLMSLLVNHKFLSYASDLGSVFGGDIIFDTGKFSNVYEPGTVHYSGLKNRVASQRAFDKESRLPKEMHSGWGMLFINEIMRSTEYTIHLAIKFTNPKNMNKKVKLRRAIVSMQETISTRYPWFKNTDAGVDCYELGAMMDHIQRKIEASDERFLEMFYHVHYWGSDEKELSNKWKAIESICKTKLPLKKEKLNIKAGWLSLMPGCETLNPIRLILPKSNVRHFMPLELPRRIKKDPKNKHCIYFHNDNGSIDALDIFDEERANNWNSIVVGGSGSGKSFLYQGLLGQYMVYKPRIAIVDYGGPGAGSYRNLVLNNGGQYLEIDLRNAQFGINPFDVKLFKDDSMETIDVDVLATLKSRMCRFLEADPSVKAVPAVVKAAIQDHLVRYFKESNNNKHGNCNLSEFAEQYLKDDPELTKSINPYKILYPFIGEGDREGEYARFFRQTKHVENKDLVCFDLEGLRNHGTLARVVIPILIEWIVDDIVVKGDIDQKKIIVCDEVAKDLQGGDLMDVYGGLVRKLRKWGGSIHFISQSLRDFRESPIGTALMQNTSYYYLVGADHSEEDLKSLEVSNKFGKNQLHDWEIKQIRTQQAKQDTWLLTPYSSSKIRYSPTRTYSLMTTTDPAEKVLLKKAMKALGHDHVTKEVIEYVLRSSEV